jgi:aryl-alcohol dehydrogenase-like predicted oxidoreductase
MVEAALKYVISHPLGPVAIPGATSVDQALFNAKAGQAPMEKELYKRLADLQ